MHTRDRNEVGESLVEILIALVIIGIVVSALYASFATASTASKSHRDLVTADAVLRNSAEATKSAVRTSCSNGGTTYSVSYSAPAGFTAPASVANQSCPPKSVAEPSVLSPLTLTVTMPNGTQKTLSIVVRTP